MIAIYHNIKIDLREMLDEAQVPTKFQPMDDVLLYVSTRARVKAG